MRCSPTSTRVRFSTCYKGFGDPVLPCLICIVRSPWWGALTQTADQRSEGAGGAATAAQASLQSLSRPMPTFQCVALHQMRACLLRASVDLALADGRTCVQEACHSELPGSAAESRLCAPVEPGLQSPCIRASVVLKCTKRTRIEITDFVLTDAMSFWNRACTCAATVPEAIAQHQH